MGNVTRKQTITGSVSGKDPGRCGPNYESQPQILTGTSPRNSHGSVNIVGSAASEIGAAIPDLVRCFLQFQVIGVLYAILLCRGPVC